MNKNRFYLPLIMIVALVIAGCRSSRHAERSTDVITGASQQVRPNNQQTEIKKTTSNALTAKLNLKLESGGKSISVGGNYRLKRGEVVQINLVYTMIVSINVGTLELTPDYIMLIDRMNKRYCRVSYSDVPDLAKAGITYDYLESIFWGEAPKSPTKVLEWSYADWQNFSDGQFPGQIVFQLNIKSSDYKATFRLSNLRASDDWETRTEVGQKYEQVTIDAVMKALLNAAN